MQKVIISILHFNNDSDTKDCLNSLLKLELNDLELETFVLDNGSKKEFKIDVSGFKKINLQVLRSNKNTGFTGGHNLIYEKVSDRNFDYFLILNNDCIVSPQLLEEMIKSFDDDKIGGVVPKIYFTKGHEYHKEKYKAQDTGRVFWYAGGFMDWDHVMSRHRGVDEVDTGQYDQAGVIDFATGACFLIRHDVIKKVGLFDEKYFLYYEDADLSKRIIRGGYDIYYQPKAVVWHNNAGSSGSGSALHDYYLTRNRMLFGMRYAPLKIKLLLIKESMRLMVSGREWQKTGIKDYYLKNFGKGSFG